MARFALTKRIEAAEGTTTRIEESNRQPATPLSEIDPEMAALFDEMGPPQRLKPGQIPNANIEGRPEDINPHGAELLTRIAALMESRVPGSTYGKGHYADMPTLAESRLV